jgi:hypothetical protein
MTETTPPTKPPRLMRAMLVGFPAGLILFSILAVMIYFRLEEQKTARSIRYAAGLREEMTAERLGRHQAVLAESKADLTRAALVAGSYVSSTLGPENMGYQTRILRESMEPDVPIQSIDVELTGQKRPRDVVLVLCDYQDPVAVSTLLGIAHDVTGEAPLRTLRIGLVKGAAELPVYYDKCLGANERVSQLLLCGSMAAQQDADLQRIFHLVTGTNILRPILGDAVRSPLQAAQALKAELLSLADRL